jgi:simple sugar transport system ATP-binding protein
MKILIGLVQADAGTIAVRGEHVAVHDPVSAATLGLAMVHQHFSLVDALTVWENVLLGERSRLDRAAARAKVVAIGERYGLEVDPDASCGALTAGQRQRVEIIKCLRRDPQILIFDEPTSVLTPAESEQLFSVLRKVVADEGRAVALVSHKLEEVMHATDVVTVMRQGRVVEHRPTSEVDARSLARAMVGRDVSLRSESAALGLLSTASTVAVEEAAADVDETPTLRLQSVSVRRRDGSLALSDLTLGVSAGEIVAVAGVEGNGQRELGDLLSSLIKAEHGYVVVDGNEVPTGSPGAMAAAGIGVIPEDRHDSGCVLDMSVAENLVLADPHQVFAKGVLNRKAMVERAEVLIEEFDILTPSPLTPMRQLSGGNQQRVVLARELSTNPKVLVAAQPTRGLDVGAIEYMGERLKAAARAGVAVLLISTELEEVLALSDRIVVLYRGAIVGSMRRGEVDLDRLGLLMGGSAA